MKRLILLAAVAFFALPAAAQMQEAFPSYIQVNGRAEKEIAPDEFYLQIIINERDSKGKISVESQQRDMIAALKRAGVDVEKQLKMANLSSEFFKKNTSVATAKYQLQLGSSAMVAKVWQALDGLGISNVVDYEAFTFKNRNKKMPRTRKSNSIRPKCASRRCRTPARAPRRWPKPSGRRSANASTSTIRTTT